VDIITQAEQTLSKIQNWISGLESRLNLVQNSPTTTLKWTENERLLYSRFEEAKVNIRISLMNNFDTPLSVLILQSLISHVNIYVANSTTLSVYLIKNVMIFILRMFSTFGIEFDHYSLQTTPKQQAADGQQILNLLVDFRSKIRKILLHKDKSVENKEEALKMKLRETLKVCDQMRDDVLPSHGIQLEDLSDLTAIAKFIDKADLPNQKQQKIVEQKEPPTRKTKNETNDNREK